MFLLINIVGQTLVNLGIDDEFVEIVKLLDLILCVLGVISP